MRVGSEGEHGPGHIRLGKDLTFYFKQDRKPLRVFSRGVMPSDFVAMGSLLGCCFEHTLNGRSLAGRPVRLLAWTEVSVGRGGRWLHAGYVLKRGRKDTLGNWTGDVRNVTQVFDLSNQNDLLSSY